jgi:HAD superfamily hydrolase (TIGR01549 family)
MLNNPSLERRISIYPDMLFALNALQKMEKEIWICTNGTRQQQQIKISLLSGQFDFSDRVVYAIDTEPKPSGTSIKQALESSSCMEALMIGDSLIDKQAAESVPIDFLYGWVFTDLVSKELDGL